MNSEDGSYLIAGFVERAERAIEKKGHVPRIGGLFREIQNELRARNKQLPTYIWNGNTDHIELFRRRL